MTAKVWPTDQLIAFLVSLGLDETRHSGDSFLNHLVGTFELLQKWDNSRSVCVAGLFHSIYSTEAFQLQTVELANRPLIRKVIGVPAERLVYLFCASDSRHFFSNAPGGAKFSLLDSFEKREFSISRSTFKSLMEMHLANALEQRHRIGMTEEQINRELKMQFSPFKAHLSPKGYSELERL